MAILKMIRSLLHVNHAYKIVMSAKIKIHALAAKILIILTKIINNVLTIVL